MGWLVVDLCPYHKLVVNMGCLAVDLCPYHKLVIVNMGCLAVHLCPYTSMIMGSFIIHHLGEQMVCRCVMVA